MVSCVSVSHPFREHLRPVLQIRKAFVILSNGLEHKFVYLCIKLEMKLVNDSNPRSDNDHRYWSMCTCVRARMRPEDRRSSLKSVYFVKIESFVAWLCPRRTVLVPIIFLVMNAALVVALVACRPI